jgi:transcriptional regulator with PAS, ATPase and Fis domain
MESKLVSGSSRCFRKTLELADQYAETPWPVLLLGETGVGKELIARRIHQAAFGPSKPFIPINCSALPANLFESELFGYEKGAFSGALQSSRGLLRAANGGTVFLDEMGELDLALQAKLLRWLDSGEVRSLGSTRTETTSVRLIAATHVDLASSVAAGKFRLDLLERLSVLPLSIPPLRLRLEDLPLLAASILEPYHVAWDEALFEGLKHFHWPGNVRQLRNVLLRAVARSQGRIEKTLIDTILAEEKALADTLRSGTNHGSVGLAEIEKRAILERIRSCQGNKKKAAKELGIAKSTLHEKIRRWELGGSLVASGT